MSAFSSENFEMRNDGTFNISNLTSASVPNPEAGVLRSIADSIEQWFPEAADQLRGIANKLDV